MKLYPQPVPLQVEAGIGMLAHGRSLSYRQLEPYGASCRLPGVDAGWSAPTPRQLVKRQVIVLIFSVGLIP